MIIDKTCAFADNLAFDGTTTDVDVVSAGIGEGEPLLVYVSGSADLAGATGFDVATSEDGSTFTTVGSFTADLAGKSFAAAISSGMKRYIRVTLAGTPTAGTWNAFLVLDAQTAK